MKSFGDDRVIVRFAWLSLSRSCFFAPTLSLLLVVLSSTFASAACEPAAQQASFYMDAGFNGRCVVRNVGDYPNSNAIGLPNDTISRPRLR